MKDDFDTTDALKGHTKKSLLKVIREKCLDCCVYQHSEVRKCHIKECSLWPYRMGNNPFRKRKMTDEKKKAATERLKKLKKEQ